MPWLPVTLGERKHRLRGSKGKLLTGGARARIRTRVGWRLGLEKLRRTKGLLVPATMSALESSLMAARASGKAPGTFVFGLRPAA